VKQGHPRPLVSRKGLNPPTNADGDPAAQEFNPEQYGRCNEAHNLLGCAIEGVNLESESQ
jgi:hypothetical protein